MPAFGLIVGLWLSDEGFKLRQQFSGHRRSQIVMAVAVTCVVVIVLNAVGLRRFSWRWPSSTTPSFVHALADTGQWSAIGIWLATFVVAVPVTEEVVFRFGLLRLLQVLSGSSRLAALGSSILFGAAHLLRSSLTQFDITNALWLVLGSLVLARIALRRPGGLVLCVTAHVVLNALETAILIVVVLFPTS